MIINHLNRMCVRARKMSTVQVLKEIFFKSVDSVKPENLIKKEIQVSERHLVITGKNYPIRRPCYVVGFGKAVLGMALELERSLRDNLKMGIVTVPAGILNKTPSNPDTRISIIEGAEDNIPDARAFKGAQEIKKLVESLSEDDLLLVLISGGGSALLPFPVPPITLEEKQSLIKKLSKKGADILELNCVRKQISLLKGGGLAELAYPSRVISLVLSDIVGDPLDFIASGPTTPNLDRAEAAIEIIHKYNTDVPDSIKKVLEENLQRPKSPIPITDGKYEHVEILVIGNNKIAAEAAKQHALSSGFQSAILSTSVMGNVARISQIYADLARNMASVICNSSSKQSLKDFLESLPREFGVTPSVNEEIINFDFSKEVCLVMAGEPTVVVNGNGKGGRNQQLALALSVELNKLNMKSADISFLSGGTDGIDGPTDAAGAIGTSDLVNNSLAENIKPEDYLDNNDCYSFYSKYQHGEFLIKIGHTGTNVMDVHLLHVKPKPSQK